MADFMVRSFASLGCPACTPCALPFFGAQPGGYVRDFLITWSGLTTKAPSNPTIKYQNRQVRIP